MIKNLNWEKMIGKRIFLFFIFPVLVIVGLFFISKKEPVYAGCSSGEIVCGTDCCPAGERCLNDTSGSTTKRCSGSGGGGCYWDGGQNYHQGWSACSVSCGGGTQSNCNQCGADCWTQACNTQSCCDANAWGGWSACSAACGGGTQSRTNACGTGASQACNTQACPTLTPIPPTATPMPTSVNPSPTITPGSPTGVICITDTKRCPDGSDVRRIPPSCEFASCPGQPTVMPLSTCAKKPQGDANCDGVIDEKDFSLWSQEFDTMVPVAPFNQNANFACVEGNTQTYFVDLVNFEIWRRNTIGGLVIIPSPTPTATPIPTSTPVPPPPTNTPVPQPTSPPAPTSPPVQPTNPPPVGPTQPVAPPRQSCFDGGDCPPGYYCRGGGGGSHCWPS